MSLRPSVTRPQTLIKLLGGSHGPWSPGRMAMESEEASTWERCVGQVGALLSPQFGSGAGGAGCRAKGIVHRQMNAEVI